MGSSQDDHDPENQVEGQITDDDIERARRQIGIPTPSKSAPWNPVPDRTSISHFAYGYGDDNPLWHDPEYGRGTRWLGQIAPPLYLISAGINVTRPFSSLEMKELFRGLFRGTGKYYSGVEWHWYRPVRPSEPIFHAGRTTIDVEVKESSFSGGRSVRETYRTTYVDRAGSPVALQDESYISAERHGSKEAGKYRAIRRAEYSESDMREVDDAYAGEERRGSTPRYYEDVTVGDTIGHVVKGPLTVFDMIAMHMGMGPGGYGIGPLRYAWDKRQRMPAFYVPDAYGVPDVVQRVHWDQQRAEELGLPAPYDYGQMRSCWLSHLVTNWMGDDGWLVSLSTQARGFNFLGDVHRCGGRVTGKREEDGRFLVELDVHATNQRGTVTTPGSATVALPSREHGPVVLPDASLEVARMGLQIAAKAANQGMGVA